MSVTPDKYFPSNSIAGILYVTTKNVPPLIKYPIYPEKGTKPHNEGSEATNTDHYHGDKETENN